MPDRNEDTEGEGRRRATVRYRPNNVLRLRITPEFDLIYSTSTKVARLIGSRIGDILARWRSPATLREMAAPHKGTRPVGTGSNPSVWRVIFRQLGVIPNILKKALSPRATRAPAWDQEAEEASEVRGALAELVAQRYLVTDESLLSRCGQLQKPRAEPARIQTLAVPTCGRPESLRDCIESYLQNAAHFGRKINVLVADDSKDPHTRLQTRQILLHIKHLYDCSFYYAGAEEKAVYVDRLEKEGLSPAAIRFALFGDAEYSQGAGANRNAILLDTMGERIFSVDDDTLCRVATHPEMRDSLALVGNEVPVHAWTFANRHQALEFLSPSALDVLGALEKLLGFPLIEVVHDFNKHSDVRVEDLCAHMLGSIECGGGRVAACFMGVLGNSGMSSPTPLLGLSDAQTRRRIVSSEETIHNALHCPESFRTVPSWIICHSPLSIGAFLGLDNTVLLPPFTPMCRNEETIFGATLQSCLANRYTAHFPWALLHLGNGRKGYARPYTDAADGISFWQVVTACLAGHELTYPVDDAAALERLGRFFLELGSLTPLDFREQICMRVWQQVSHEVAFWENLLHRYSRSPALWARVVDEWIKHRIESALRLDFIVPRDLIANNVSNDVIRTLQRAVHQLGELFQSWPHIAETAISLRRRGIRLAQELRH